MIEREYKFLVDKLPEYYDRKIDIVQIYFNPTSEIFKILDIDSPFKCISRIRIQTEDGKTKYVLNIKGKGNIEREEFEKEISYKQAKHILSSGIKSYLKKTRYIVSQNDFCFEFDEYKEHLKGLLTCEVELDSLAISPDMIREKLLLNFDVRAKDVSLDKKYKNTNLAKKIENSKELSF